MSRVEWEKLRTPIYVFQVPKFMAVCPALDPLARIAARVCIFASKPVWAWRSTIPTRLRAVAG